VTDEKLVRFEAGQSTDETVRVRQRGVSEAGSWQKLFSSLEFFADLFVAVFFSMIDSPGNDSASVQCRLDSRIIALIPDSSAAI